MSCIYHEDNKQNIYEKNLEEVSKRIKDIPAAEKEARILTEKSMNHKGTKPMDYQAKLIIPVDVALKHQYGLLNNVIHMDIPLENTQDTIVVNIEVENINSMAIKKIYANKKTHN